MIQKPALIHALAVCLIPAFLLGADNDSNLANCERKIKGACEMITVFITGNELGELRPCGCSGGQLGGFDRRSTILKSIAPEQRMIIDTGNFLAKQDEQSLIKLDIMMQAFSMLGYDVINLTEKDLMNSGQIEGTQLKFVSAANGLEPNFPKSFSKQMQLGSETILILVAAASDEESLHKVSEEFQAAGNSNIFRILIFNGSQDDAEKHLAEMSNVNVVIAQSESDEPGILKMPEKGPMLISAGKLGKYAGRLDISRKNAGKFDFTFRSVAIRENIAQDPVFLDLYKSYQTIIKEQNLLERYPRFVLPKNLQYVGSSSCGLKGCHDYEYNTASKQKHAHAFESLVLVGSDNDPECVICHSIGMEYNSGFISEQKTPELKDVGCENCHGPGSRHLVTAGKEKTTGPKSKCLDCHTSEQSANYAGQQNQYCEKIYHWREPNAFDCVQY